jgi:2-C-methyl-D-erythritol 4-phosphate cytidylyltransferase
MSPTFPVDSPLVSPVSSGATVQLWALIPCAGSGSRAGGSGPKQYQPLAGKPMVRHTLAAFEAVASLAKTLVVVSPGDVFWFDSDAQNAPFSIADCGGSTRAESVFNGLNALLQQGAAATDWVLVHDAARCLVTPAQILNLIDACLHDTGHDAAGGLLALPLPDTLKSESQGRVATTLPRAGKWLAQTPQMFRIGPLLQALRQAREQGVEVTDESSAMEAAGFKPLLVPGSAQNFKVTYPEDFALAEAVLCQRKHLIKI